MDTTETITHISLCAGYGGIDLGLKRVIPTLRTIAFSEIEVFACANLVAKMEEGLLDAAPIWSNLKTLPWDGFLGKVDILSGGFPCQPFSCAGKREGDEDPRHLFPYILDGIRRCRPSVVFLENVEGILSAKLTEDNWRDPTGTPVLLHVLRELERVGYKATAGIFSASEVGAPHQRKRVFIMAHSTGSGFQTFWNKYFSQRNEKSACEPSELAHCDGNGSTAGIPRQESWNEGATGSSYDHSGQGVWPSRPGQPQHSWEPPRVVGNTNRRGREESEHLDPNISPESSGCDTKELGDTKNKRKLNEAEQDISQAGSLLDRASEGASMGNAESIRPSTRRPEHEGFSGKLRTPSASDEGLGNAENRSNGQLPSEQQGGNPVGGSGEEGRSCAEQELKRPDGCNERQAEPSMGGDPNGTANRMGDAELFVSCDNRTDELRLLGNGVVPATAEIAWRILSKSIVEIDDFA